MGAGSPGAWQPALTRQHPAPARRGPRRGLSRLPASGLAAWVSGSIWRPARGCHGGRRPGVQARRGSRGTGRSLGGCANPPVPGHGVPEVEAQARALLPRRLHLPASAPSESRAPTFPGLQTHPATRRPTFISPHSRHCLRAFTDMLIPGPPRARRGEGARGPGLGLGDRCRDGVSPASSWRAGAPDAGPRLAAAAFGWETKEAASDRRPWPGPAVRAFSLTPRGSGGAWPGTGPQASQTSMTFPGSPRERFCGPLEGSTPCRALSF